MIWLTSDWHFCHNKPFIYESRGFTNIQEMNKTIIEKYNSVVNINDDVYCLGDCILNNLEEGIKCIKSLKGKIHIIRGNHCTDNKVEAYKKCYNVVEVCDIKIIKYSKTKTFYLSHYPTICSNYTDNKNNYVINICGHKHCKNKFQDMDKGLIYHVELDAHNMYPVSIEQIFTDIEKKVREYEN